MKITIEFDCEGKDEILISESFHMNLVALFREEVTANEVNIVFVLPTGEKQALSLPLLKKAH